MYINGLWVKTSDKLAVENPATRQVVDEVYMGGKKETQEAIQAAKRSFKNWSSIPSNKRSEYLYEIAKKIDEKKEQLARTITMEMGKSIHYSRYEVDSAIAYFKWYAEEARRVYGDLVPSSDKNKRIQVLRQPVGVVAAITPWNFPLSMGARKLGPALAVGCTIVMKPSSEAPLSTIELFKIFNEINLPKGVANLVIGKSGPIAEVIMNCKDIRKISFTGSTEVGKKLIRQSAETVKRVSMELGGHAPFIVFKDADLELAASGLIRSKFASNGQQCVCANRIYVQESIYDEFTKIFLKKVKEIRVGNGMDESTDMGPLINDDAINSVHTQVMDAVEKGAKVVCGGNKMTEPPYESGYFYPPTILTEVDESMNVVFEETFGPVTPIMKFETEDEVVEKANNTNYGLASYFFTNDLSRAHRVSEKLEYGIVGVNDAAPFPVQSSFGGVKESGLGSEGGKYGLHDYLELKTVSVAIKV